MALLINYKCFSVFLNPLCPIRYIRSINYPNLIDELNPEQSHIKREVTGLLKLESVKLRNHLNLPKLSNVTTEDRVPLAGEPREAQNRVTALRDDISHKWNQTHKVDETKEWAKNFFLYYL